MINSITPSTKELEILKIPPKTTSMVQPLDKYGFRLWKNFVRRFSDRVVLDGLDVDLYQRNNIIKLQSLVHNRAPKGSPALRESRGTRGNPAGTGGIGTKNFKCGTGRDSRKGNAFPQNSLHSRTVKILSH